jgi:hypothetical protein
MSPAAPARFDQDNLSQSPGVSARVRRIRVALDCALAFNKHQPLTTSEGACLFNLGDASRLLDGVALLPGMGPHEDKARRDLLELYDVFAGAWATGAADEYSLRLPGSRS